LIAVVADADTLFGATSRALLIHLDYEGLIRLHRSPLILEEMSRALVATGRKPNADAARRHEGLMRAALPHAEIPTQQVQRHFGAVAGAMRSAKGIHVAACAHALLGETHYPDVQVVNLVTRNMRDFGVRKLTGMGIEVARPDTFLLGLMQRHPTAVASAFARLRASLRSTPTREQLLERLAADGQTQSANALRAIWQSTSA
jgi:hypothetical protein